MQKTKYLNLSSILLAVAVIFTVWIPSTRIFLTDVAYCNVVVLTLSVLLCAVSYISFKKNKSKLSLLPFLVGLSPAIFVAIIVIIALSGAPLAP